MAAAVNVNKKPVDVRQQHRLQEQNRTAPKGGVVEPRRSDREETNGRSWVKTKRRCCQNLKPRPGMRKYKLQEVREYIYFYCRIKSEPPVAVTV